MSQFFLHSNSVFIWKGEIFSYATLSHHPAIHLLLPFLLQYSVCSSSELSFSTESWSLLPISLISLWPSLITSRLVVPPLPFGGPVFSWGSLISIDGSLILPQSVDQHQWHHSLHEVTYFLPGSWSCPVCILLLIWLPYRRLSKYLTIWEYDTLSTMSQ